MELPPLEDIEGNISKADITKDSLIVVVGRGSTSGSLATNIAAGFLERGWHQQSDHNIALCGVRNVAILDGGYEKWAVEGKPTTTVIPTITPVTYEAIVNEEMFVDIEYVEKAIIIGKSIIVDARDPEVYNCVIQEPWTTKKGRIPTAVNLPVPSLWEITYETQTSARYTTYKV